MKRVLTIAATVAAFALLSCSAVLAGGGPITKQNGSSPVSTSFTPICAVPGLSGYGFCAGSTTTFSGVKGRLDAVQSKAGRYDLTLTYTGLTPGATYILFGNRDALAIPGTISGFFTIAKAPADGTGKVSFAYQTTEPTNLAFDLNQAETAFDQFGVTIITTYWSKQFLHVNADTTLSLG